MIKWVTELASAPQALPGYLKMKSMTVGVANSMIRTITIVVQLMMITVSCCMLFYGHWVVLVILIPSLLLDQLIKLMKGEAIAFTVKLIFLLQAIAMWVIFSTQVLMSANFDSSSALSQTKNDIHLQHTHHHYEKPIPVSQQPLQINDRNAHRHAELALPSRTARTLKVYNHNQLHRNSTAIIESAIGHLPQSSFPDLKYRPKDEVRSKLATVFAELPTTSYLAQLQNPCWTYDVSTNPWQTVSIGNSELFPSDNGKGLACLPYAYILGQPKCGTSDLFERLKRHPQIRMPRRKEVRWFTRGEFTTNKLGREGRFDGEDGAALQDSREKLLGPKSSVFTFTNSFIDATKDIAEDDTGDLITIDGGPHTFWWPTQSPDGELMPEDIPAPQIIREMQPNAKFIITLSDPVHRLYSDYYFLDDNLRPVRRGSTTKSAQQFHDRCKQQVADMTQCIQDHRQALRDELLLSSPSSSSLEDDLQSHGPLWFRAAQECAHDRHKFAVGGWGRLAIGMYATFMAKWLEHFSADQFLVVRLEDYASDPEGYMSRIFKFLEIDEVKEWGAILNMKHANENNNLEREPILEETEVLLRSFYKVYNEILSKLLNNDEGFLWDVTNQKSLREIQLEEAQKERQPDPRDGPQGLLGDMHDLDLGHRHNQHGMARQFHEDQQHDHAAPPPPPPQPLHHQHPQQLQAAPQHIFRQPFHSQLRGPAEMFHQQQQQGGQEISDEQHARNEAFVNTFKPESFSIDDLPTSHIEGFNKWLSDGTIDRTRPITDENTAGLKLASAVFGLDINAVKYLLYEVGIPANVRNSQDANRNAFHTVSMVHVMADAHPRSQVFAILKGHETWLSEYIQPNTPLHQHSVYSRDIIDGLTVAAVNVARWLLRAGTDVNARDGAGNTPLHHAAVGGQVDLIRFLLEEAHAEPDVYNFEGRTPLHFAAALGHTEACGILVQNKAKIDATDSFGTTPLAIMENPGPLYAADVKKFLNITQRPPRKIERLIHPERHPDVKGTGWVHGTGGWHDERIPGFEEDLACDVDQYWAHEVTGEMVFKNYIARNSPILIRGLIEDWRLNYELAMFNLSTKRGDLRVEVSDIPYSAKFGGAGRVDMTLGEYIEEAKDHRIVGGKHPWYVFRGHPIPSMSEAANSLVNYESCPTPKLIEDTFRFFAPPNMKEWTGKHAREVFVNAQWALGGEGTGAPIHFHNTAWAAVIYGAKKWAVYSPHHMIMSNMQILEYFETDKQAFEKRNIFSTSCVQMAGDVMIIPESWGHGVLNIQETVAMATEARQAHWRMKPGTSILGHLPNDNRRDTFMPARRVG